MNYTFTEHVIKEPAQRSGDVSTWKEAFAFLLFGIAIAALIWATAP
jgi:hypothetical protein